MVFNIFKKTKEKPLWPWEGKQPIYEYLISHIDDQGVLSMEVEGLPDDDEYFATRPFRWVSGGAEGVFGLINQKGEPESRADELAALIKEQVQNPGPHTRRATYLALLADDIFYFVDTLLGKIAAIPDLNHSSLYQEAVWMASKGAHRGVVKAGIAILGMFNCEREKDLLITLGKHDEFTLYVTVAVLRGFDDPYPELINLGNCVDGWGKVHLVQHLRVETEDVRDWLLRHGCENSVDDGYLAYICATEGGPHKALDQIFIDSELFQGTGVIIKALIAGGPAEDMDDYEHSRSVVVNYLRHARVMAGDLRDFSVLNSILDYLEEGPEVWDGRYAKGWDEGIRGQCLLAIREIMRQGFWRDLVLRDIESDYYHLAFKAADRLGIDTWPVLYGKLENDPYNSGLYFDLMLTDDAERTSKLVDFAERHLPLNKIAEEPGDEMGFAQEMGPHFSLDAVLQGLERFPGVGGRLVLLGLHCRIIRHQNGALHALEAWPRNHWPQGTEEALQNLYNRTKDEEIRKRLGILKSGI